LQAVLSTDCTARAAAASTRNLGTGDDRASAEQTTPAGIARSGRHSVSTTGAGPGGLADDTPEAYGGAATMPMEPHRGTCGQLRRFCFERHFGG
jgi:hypothetical protein